MVVNGLPPPRPFVNLAIFWNNSLALTFLEAIARRTWLPFVEPTTIILLINFYLNVAATTLTLEASRFKLI